MNNEKEIEIMEKLIIDGGNGRPRRIAEWLVCRGIGDKKQAVKKAFDKLKEIGKNRAPRCTCNGIEIDISQPFVITNKDLDKLFAELYGE